ncbi:MAG: hypothetical protein LH606_08100 [Cytophagaceae bacterium]|nr:hypothetical protein [Cytophagaceae bacterium]
MKTSFHSLMALSCAGLLLLTASCDTADVVPTPTQSNADPKGIWGTPGQGNVMLFKFQKPIVITGSGDPLSRSDDFSLNGISLNNRNVLVYVKMEQIEGWHQLPNSLGGDQNAYSFVLKTPSSAPPTIALTRQSKTSTNQPSVFTALRVLTIPNEDYNPVRLTINWSDYATVCKHFNLPE